MSGKPIHRITLFKIPSSEDQQKLLEIYSTMRERATKDNKPYILSVTPGVAFPDLRAQGYTVSVISVFKSVADMEYYDNECVAHKALKDVGRSLHQGILMIYFESILD